MKEALKLTLAALKQIDEAMPFPVAKLAIMEAEKALAQQDVRDEIDRGAKILRETYLAQPKQEPVAWATREDFYRELDRSVNRMRRQMEIKGVVMRCANYDVALPVIDIREGHVLVGQVTTPPQRTWVGLTKAQCGVLWKTNMTPFEYYQAIEDKLKEKNTSQDGECKYCVNGCHACDARRQSNVLP